MRQPFQLRRLVQPALSLVPIALIAVVVFLAATATGASTIKNTITETGSSLEAPWLLSLQLPYSKADPTTLLSPTTTNSGTGIKEAASGLVNIGAADLPASQPGLVSIPLVVAAVATVYHVPDVPALKLNGNVLAQMYSGRITHWDDPQIVKLNPRVKLPHLLVRPVVRSDSSGSTFQFSTYLQMQSNSGFPVPGTLVSWPSLASRVEAQGSDAMVKACAATMGCVAYLGVSYESTIKTDGLGIASLANGTGKYVQPTDAAIADALAIFASNVPSNGQLDMVDAPIGYPIINLEYAIVKTHLPQTSETAAIQAFLRWAVTDGSTAKYLEAVHFARLPAAPLAVTERLINSLNH
jgi:phosphate transport system substrate-binding protein